MKLIKGILFFGILTIVVSLFAGQAEAAKWKGSWYLSGTDECKEIVLNRKGKSDLISYPKAIVEKKNGDYYLTVASYGKKYSYRMDKLDDGIFRLELLSTGPQGTYSHARTRDMYTGMYRMLIDCQTGAK